MEKDGRTNRIEDLMLIRLAIILQDVDKLLKKEEKEKFVCMVEREVGIKINF